MSKTSDNQNHWNKLFPEFEVQEPNLPESLPQEQTMQSTLIPNYGDNHDLDWASISIDSTLPSLTTNDIYSIDFANIGNLTTINLSALSSGSGSASAIWTASSYTWDSTSATSVKIDTDGVHIPEGKDIFLGNLSLSDRLDRIESRLAILKPNPELEEEFQELKELGDQYRALEAHIKEKMKTFDTLRRE